jgi:hypothetical protein
LRAFCQNVGQIAASLSNIHQMATYRLSYRQRQFPRFKKLDALMPEAEHMHGVFRVIPKLFNKLDAVYVPLAPFADKSLPLRFQVTKESFTRVPRCECGREFLQFFPDFSSDHQSVIRQVQQKKHGWIALQR